MSSDVVHLGDLLRRHGLHLKKRLGQNFLADPVHLDRIVAAAELGRDDVVLEIGPGVGTLTARLARQAGQVIAVELDAGLLPALRETLLPYPNVTIVQGDILVLNPFQLIIDNCPFTIDNYKVVANLPYYITSAAIRHLLSASVRPELIVLTVQREVAQRIIAKPPEMSLLAVSVQLFAQPEIVARIPAGAFYPPPKVDSAILRLRPWQHPPVELSSEDIFFEVVRAGFSQRRKQLRNSLKSGLALPVEVVLEMLQKTDISPERRAETLTLDEWGRLAQEHARLLGERA
jgi:16S rRNA (adenine1518-N6/adenine1519-N6)-dimethyltransferase